MGTKRGIAMKGRVQKERVLPIGAKSFIETQGWVTQKGEPYRKGLIGEPIWVGPRTPQRENAGGPIRVGPRIPKQGRKLGI